MENLEWDKAMPKNVTINAGHNSSRIREVDTQRDFKKSSSNEKIYPIRIMEDSCHPSFNERCNHFL